MPILWLHMSFGVLYLQQKEKKILALSIPFQDICHWYIIFPQWAETRSVRSQMCYSWAETTLCFFSSCGIVCVQSQVSSWCCRLFSLGEQRTTIYCLG